jgi:hypothetical protein
VGLASGRLTDLTTAGASPPRGTRVLVVTIDDALAFATPRRNGPLGDDHRDGRGLTRHHGQASHPAARPRALNPLLTRP